MSAPRDITGEVCGFHPPSGTVPMYSFDRPAYNFWQGAFCALIEFGMSEKQAFDWLQSKSPRWMLDNHADEVQALGHDMVAAYIAKNGAE